MATFSTRLGAACLAAVCWANAAHAQQMMVTNSTPFNSANHSFFERNGFSWSLTRQGGSGTGPFFLNVGGFNQAVPPFGGFAPGAGVTGGAAFVNPPWSLNIFGEFSQGARSSIVSQTPVLTTMNGIPGLVADQAQSPFVISVIPVVGQRDVFQDHGASNTVRGRLLRGELRSLSPEAEEHGPPPAIDYGPRAQVQQAPAQLAHAAPPFDPAFAPPGRPAAPVKMEPLVVRSGDAPPATRLPTGGGGTAAGPSSAEQSAVSVEEIRRRQAAEREAALAADLRLAQESFDKGEQALGEGKTGVAKIHFEMALRRANPEMRAKIESRLRTIGR